MKKPSANERRLAKLLQEASEPWMMSAGDCEGLATHLASRGGLAISAKTVPDDEVAWLPFDGGPVEFRTYLRRLARGGP
jgi:hypothetical protein